MLRARATPDVFDRGNLAEEIDFDGKRRKLESQFRRINAPYPQWQTQPGLRGPSWQRTLRPQCARKKKLPRRSPSLLPQMAELIGEAYQDALADALAVDWPSIWSAFPAACRFNAE